MVDYLIHNVYNSNFANAMIKYLVACNISERVPSATLSNYFLPAWNIDIKPVHFDMDKAASFADDMRLDYMRIEYMLKSGIQVIALHGHLQRVENLPSRQLALSKFPVVPGLGISFGSDCIVCPVRAAEILTAPHPDYVLLPVDFYRQVFSMNPGIRVVFMGQTAPNVYTSALREAFPDALFLPTQGALADFHTIRLSKRIIVPVSTFAWLGSWMSDAEEIVIPAFGLFNPMQTPDNDFVHLGDKRYVFYKFPVQKAVPVQQVMEAHRAISGQWQRVSATDLARLHR